MQNFLQGLCEKKERERKKKEKKKKKRKILYPRNLSTISCRSRPGLKGSPYPPLFYCSHQWGIFAEMDPTLQHTTIQSSLGSQLSCMQNKIETLGGGGGGLFFKYFIYFERHDSPKRSRPCDPDLDRSPFKLSLPVQVLVQGGLKSGKY